MLLASRIWVGALGLLTLLPVLSHWLNVTGLAEERGVQAIGLIGRANVRADMGGIFLAIGILAVIAAWKRGTIWLLAAIIVPSSALLGRFVSIALDGYEARVLQPILVELVVIGLFTAALVIWRKAPEGL